MRPLLKPKDVARTMGITTRRLAKMREEKRGPRYIEVGIGDARLVRYVAEDVERWMIASRSKSIDF